MLYLATVSVIWAFSFSLIKHRLSGVDPDLVAFLRLALALVVFLPLLRPRGMPPRLAARLLGIGGLQFGIMYVAVMNSYRHLAAYQVAVLTIFTPLWVAAIEDLLRRAPTPRNYLGAALAVVGAGLIVFQGGGARATWAGVALVQAANLAFAAGQVLYRRLALDRPDREAFALLYLGGALVAGLAAVLDAGPIRLTAGQALTIVYLGAVASGLGFFLWNVGARKVSVGALAVWNNGYIPLAVLVSLLFGERADPARLAAGSALLGLGLWASHGSPGGIEPCRPITARPRSSRGTTGSR
jgi:drug/metabolite transporter (DMT)-like permease